VADLANQLSISKSGFYWHFHNRADLLEAMKLYWVDEFSHRFIKDVQSDEHPVRERLVSLVQTIRASNSGKLDLAFTSWAQTDPSVHDLVARVWDLRIAFIKDLLSSTGVSDAELASRARLFVVYFSWSEVMFEPTTQGFADEDLDTILDIIVGDKRG
jgi:AcrR family transcriptional regulator